MSQPPEDRVAAVRLLGVQLASLLSEARGYMQSVAEGLTPPTSPAAFNILQRLHAQGPTRASVLADVLGMDRSALSRLTKQLREQGHVEAATANTDARGVVLMLTPTAQASVSEALASKAAAFDARLADWSIADLERLALLLQRLNDTSPVPREVSREVPKDVPRDAPREVSSQSRP